jgi:hypothetical protein
MRPFTSARNSKHLMLRWLDEMRIPLHERASWKFPTSIGKNRCRPAKADCQNSSRIPHCLVPLKPFSAATHTAFVVNERIIAMRSSSRFGQAVPELKAAFAEFGLFEAHFQSRPWNDRVWKAWKAKRPAFHPSHTLWKSLRDYHIPTVSTAGIFQSARARETDPRPLDLKGVVTDVPGPKCNECSGLISQLGCSHSKGVLGQLRWALKYSVDDRFLTLLAPTTRRLATRKANTRLPMRVIAPESPTEGVSIKAWIA